MLATHTPETFLDMGFPDWYLVVLVAYVGTIVVLALKER